MEVSIDFEIYYVYVPEHLKDTVKSSGGILQVLSSRDEWNVIEKELLLSLANTCSHFPQGGQ